MVALVVATGFAARADWVPATPDYQWSFPQDHWAHDGFKTEWW
jgi:predicted secreted hydrolase